MLLATIVVSVLLAALMTYAAARKLTHAPGVVETYDRVGVPEERLNLLARILISGSACLLLGLFWAPIGIVASIAVVAYFLAAIAAHVRHEDLENVSVPIAMEILAIAALALRITSA